MNLLFSQLTYNNSFQYILNMFTSKKTTWISMLQPPLPVQKHPERWCELGGSHLAIGTNLPPLGGDLPVLCPADTLVMDLDFFPRFSWFD